jgi:hypothetical protein
MLALLPFPLPKVHIESLAMYFITVMSVFAAPVILLPWFCEIKYFSYLLAFIELTYQCLAITLF